MLAVIQRSVVQNSPAIAKFWTKDLACSQKKTSNTMILVQKGYKAMEKSSVKKAKPSESE